MTQTLWSRGTTLFPAGVVNVMQTHDFDELAAVPACWDQQYWQLGRGRFEGRSFAAHTSRLQVSVHRVSPGIMVLGQLPPGCAAIGIPLTTGATACHRGEELLDNAAAVILPGREIDFQTFNPYEALVVVADQE